MTVADQSHNTYMYLLHIRFYIILLLYKVQNSSHILQGRCKVCISVCRLVNSTNKFTNKLNELLQQYRACVVDSVLWYIHRQACLSMITNTLCIHVSTNKLCITLCVCMFTKPSLSCLFAFYTIPISLFI